MGQSQSLLLKSTHRDENDRIKYATSSMQGLRQYMEDASATILDLDGTRSTSFFGVYDGHGGANVALYCASQFHTELLRDEAYHNNPDDAVEHVFFRMDEELREYDEWRAKANPRRFSFNLLNCFNAPVCVKLQVGVVVILSAWLLSWRSSDPKFSLAIVPWLLSLILFPESREPLTLKEAQPPWFSLEETRSLWEVLVILAAYSRGMVRQWIYPPITNQTFRMNVRELKMLEDE